VLNKINVKGFKSLKEESLELKPLTIVTGTNSSGKSTLLQSILFAFRHSSVENQLKMESLTNYLDKFSDVRNKYINAKEVYIKIEQSDYTFELTYTNEGVDTSGELNVKIDSPENSPEPEVFYLTANRRGPEEFAPTSRSKIGTTGEFVFSYFDSVKNRTLEAQNCKFKESLTLGYQVGRWLSFITDTNTELRTEVLGTSKVKVIFEDKNLGQLSPLNLGAGMSYVAKLIIICLSAKKNDIVIIENPEIHLHPKAQAHLANFFSYIVSLGVQVILESHCEHLINKIRYLTFKKNLSNEKVIFHYKSSVEEQFASLKLNQNGHYINLNGEKTIFPSGFFDGTLTELIEIGA